MFNSCLFSSAAQAIAGVAELEEISWIITHRLQQAAIALIDLIPPVPQGFTGAQSCLQRS